MSSCNLLAQASFCNCIPISVLEYSTVHLVGSSTRSLPGRCCCAPVPVRVGCACVRATVPQRVPWASGSHVLVWLGCVRRPCGLSQCVGAAPGGRHVNSIADRGRFTQGRCVLALQRESGRLRCTASDLWPVNGLSHQRPTLFVFLGRGP